MKLTHKLCGAALLAAVGVSLAIPNTTKAFEDPDKNTGAMDIQFTRKTDGTIDDSANSEGSGSMSLPGQTYKEFGVMGVTPLSFGEQVATATERSYWAKNWTQATGVSANYVLINDGRMVADHKYNVSAKITKPLTSGTSKLDGSTLTYSNIHLQTQASIGEKAKLKQTMVKDNVTISSIGSKDIIVNTEEGGGQGQTYITFGHREAGDATDSTKSVKLDIGKDDVIVEGKYEGEVTWTMSTVPVPETPAS